MLNTAAVLFVRNDIENLGWWLAHHAAIGFSTLIVCDDSSTDGTAALLESAAAFHDIRIYSTDPNLSSPTERRQKFERQVLTDAEGEFDWLLLLAVDEFLHLEHAASVEDFLTATDTPASINWCIFGSNDQHTSAPFAPTERFSHHAPLDFPDHTITRQFIEPGPSTALPDPFAATDTAADWSQARILHFACGDRRSFEHKMAPATPDVINAAWDHFNRNDQEWTGANRWLDRTRTLHAAIDQARLAELHCQLTQSASRDFDGLAQQLAFSTTPEAHTPAPHAPTNVQYFNIGRTHRLVLNTVTKDLQSIPEHALEHAQHIPLILSVERPSSTTGIASALLTTKRPSNQAFLNINGVASRLAYIPLHIHTHENSIISPVTQNPITLPSSEQNLTKINAPHECVERLQSYYTLTAQGHSLASLVHGIRQQDIIDASALGCAIALLPADDAERLSRAFPGLVPASVRPLL